jgi:hypothetical protein
MRVRSRRGAVSHVAMPNNPYPHISIAHASDFGFCNERVLIAGANAGSYALASAGTNVV